MNNIKKVKVTILGKDYLLSTDDDEKLVLRAAEVVDFEMKTATSQLKTKNSFSAAVLVALQLASDLEKLRNRVKSQEEVLSNLNSLLDDKLETKTNA